MTDDLVAKAARRAARSVERILPSDTVFILLVRGMQDDGTCYHATCSPADAVRVMRSAADTIADGRATPLGAHPAPRLGVVCDGALVQQPPRMPRPRRPRR